MCAALCSSAVPGSSPCGLRQRGCRAPLCCVWWASVSVSGESLGGPRGHTCRPHTVRPRSDPCTSMWSGRSLSLTTWACCVSGAPLVLLYDCPDSSRARLSSAPVPSSVLVRGAPCGRPRAGTGSLVSPRLTARDVFLALGELGPSGLGFRVAVGSSVHVGRRDSWRSPRCHPALALLLGELVSSVKAGAPGELAWCPRSELPSAWARFPASHELITRHGAG